MVKIVGSGLMNTMRGVDMKIIEHPIYITCVFFIVMPCIGIILANENMGFALCAMGIQAIWFFEYLLPLIRED